MDLSSSLDAVLKNHLIMKVVGGYLSCQDLGNCRIASKSFYGAITPFYRQTAVVTSVEGYLDRLEEGDTDLGENPFRQFHFSESDSFVWSEDMVSRFWKKCAPLMTYIKLEGFTKLARLNNMVFIISDEKAYKDAAEFKAPNLKTLVLDGVDVKCENVLLKLLFHDDGFTNGENLKKLSIKRSFIVKDFTDTDLIKLVLRYPTIEALSLRIVSGPFSRSKFSEKFEKMLTSLYEIRRNNFKSFNLKTLDILMGDRCDVSGIGEETSRLLNELRFPLESLSVDIGTDPSVNDVTSLLSTYNGTLKKLELFSGAGSNYCIDEFNFQVGFDALKILRISAFNSLGYLQFMPNLELLHIYSTMVKEQFESGGFSPLQNLRRTMKSMTEGTENLKLNSLKEFRYDFQIEPEQVSYLEKWMPNLKSLTLVNLNNMEDLYNLELFSGLAKLTTLIFLNETVGCISFKNGRKIKNLDKLAVLPISAVKIHNQNYGDDDSSSDVDSSSVHDPGSRHYNNALIDYYDSEDLFMGWDD